MESRIIKTVAVLGVPGVALGVFYLLLRQFGFTFSTIGPSASTGVAILFLLMVGGITFYALYRWAPSKPSDTTQVRIRKNTIPLLEFSNKLFLQTVQKQSGQWVKYIQVLPECLSESSVEDCEARLVRVRILQDGNWKDRFTEPLDLTWSVRDTTLCTLHPGIPQRLNVAWVSNQQGFISAVEISRIEDRFVFNTEGPMRFDVKLLCKDSPPITITIEAYIVERQTDGRPPTIKAQLLREDIPVETSVYDEPGVTHAAFTSFRKISDEQQVALEKLDYMVREFATRYNDLRERLLHFSSDEQLREQALSALDEGQARVLFYSCFISYSSKDESFAERLYADLQNSGVRCWFAPHDIQGGKKIHEQIDEATRIHDRLLLILSETSMNSEWVKTEIANARKKELDTGERVLFPISIVPFETIRAWKAFDADSGKDSAREIREYYIPDFSDWKNYEKYQSAFERLLRDLTVPAATVRSIGPSNLG